MVELCLAQKLKVKRLEKKMSREEVARLVGVSLMTVTRWEAKNFKPSRLAQEKIKKVLEVL